MGRVQTSLFKIRIIMADQEVPSTEISNKTEESPQEVESDRSEQAKEQPKENVEIVAEKKAEETKLAENKEVDKPTIEVKSEAKQETIPSESKTAPSIEKPVKTKKSSKKEDHAEMGDMGDTLFILDLMRQRKEKMMRKKKDDMINELAMKKKATNHGCSYGQKNFNTSKLWSIPWCWSHIGRITANVTSHS